MSLRDDIVAEAREYMPNTRWRHQARVKGVAVDCLGILICLAITFALEGHERLANDERLKSYGRTPDPVILLSACDEYMERIQIQEAKPADVLVFRFKDGPQHFALISQADPMYVIHAYAQARRVVENGMPLANASVVRAYRFRGIA